MAEYPPPTLSDSVIAEPRLPLDYRRIEIVDPQMAAIYRSKTVAERLNLVQQAHRAARLIMAMGIRLQHPHLNEEVVNQEVARRLLRGAG